MRNEQVIDLNASLINKPITTSKNGGTLFSSLSPFYIPENLSLNVNQNESILYLTFHYTNDVVERREVRRLSDEVVIELGKKKRQDL